MAPAFTPTSSSALTPPIPTGSGFGRRTQATRWRYDSARASTTRFTQPEEPCAPNAQAASPSRAERRHRIYSSRGRPGSTRERLLRKLRTEGRWDPQIPNLRAPAAAAEQICNLARIILGPYVQKGQP